MDAHTFTQAKVGSSRHGLLHTFLDDVLEDSRCCQLEGPLLGQIVQKQQHDSSRGSNKVTLRDLIRERCWARNTTITNSGYTPVELAAGRRPTDHSDLELMKPDQLSAVDLPRDATLNELRKLALRAHLEARQSADLRRDLARKVLPSDGPYAHGDRVFVWIDDKAKYKAVGRWARARVISQNGAIVHQTTHQLPSDGQSHTSPSISGDLSVLCCIEAFGRSDRGTQTGGP